MGWILNSMGCFGVKIRVILCHMVAKNAFVGDFSAHAFSFVFHYQMFLIFAYL